MASIETVNWNPRRPVVPGRLGRIIPVRRPVNNFGDLIGPMIVSEIVRREGLIEKPGGEPHRLLAVGSILRLAHTGDTLWGIGANGKSLDDPFDFTSLDVRAVRGPRTRDLLLGLGIPVPEVFGDPGLLVGSLWSRSELAGRTADRGVTIIPNLNDLAHYDLSDTRVVDPRTPLAEILGIIAASDFVTGSSLHAIVVAEALGIPARLIVSGAEPLFKYSDYYAGSGRTAFTPASGVDEAVALGGEPGIEWDVGALLRAFPRDLWAATA
ncbi:hypothetical protein B7R54_03190 [Subtercola boreus]|uniref:Polysaccharide pyruvyl transferase domain-containing protein n=1 Tax=Subtercola boreus TaxID=120213 RepID=A0A3E0VG47_9MICO|nr:polysaccharide pyruvyl transferase family protein [Subtercola boreus]RFA08340.1 hypothetical protein B7R54_03190 [Subtercola boreus]TQL54757.1 pyruvyl transferase [Subtercola boreus]